MIKVKVKKLVKEAVIPYFANAGDSGADLTAISKSYDEYGNVVYGTGIAIELPIGFEAQIRPRSSLSKYCLVLANSIGTIDQGYRGELILKFKPTARYGTGEKSIQEYEIGDKVGQLVVKRTEPILFTDESETFCEDTQRGSHGFGSSGL
jgi:dUTP pyrophosphatase